MCSTRLLVCVAVGAFAWGACSLRVAAQEASVENGYDIRGVACSPEGRCAPFSHPTQAATQMQCQSLAGMFGMAEWQSLHPAWTVKEWHCAARDERGL